jgi:predicted RNA-binding Zn ribbon-like protein
VDLASYAELAVRLVNTDQTGYDEGDQLTGLESLRELVSGMPGLSARVTRNDLDAVGMLRADLRSIFSAAAAEDDARAVELLNELLIQHPIHPQLSDHDSLPWHLHLTQSGSVADQYAAGAVMGLAVVVTRDGIDRLGLCEASSCRSAYIDTTTNRSRRYCSDRCANRSNVAAYRARQRDEGGETAGA